MKLIFTVFLFASFAAQASPFMTVKDRLRLDLWINGLEEEAQQVKAQEKGQIQEKELPEELERALSKM